MMWPRYSAPFRPSRCSTVSRRRPGRSTPSPCPPTQPSGVTLFHVNLMLLFMAVSFKLHAFAGSCAMHIGRA